MERTWAAGSPKNRAITIQSIHIKKIFTLIYEMNDVNKCQYIHSSCTHLENGGRISKKGINANYKETMSTEMLTV